MINDSAIPRGFRFGAVAAGIKYADRLDLAMMLVESPAGAAAAALFTTNLVKAAPLVAGAQHLKKSAAHMRALIVNSGNANCANGSAGLRGCRCVCNAFAREIGARETQIFPSSTGVIGMPFPAQRVIAALPRLTAGLAATPPAAEQFARAIMTTDTRPKLAAAAFTIGSGPHKKEVRLLGMAKGAGMIHPNMATMLGYVYTDVKASPAQLHRALASAARESFNSISVDGDTSTNDTLAIFASGASEIVLESRVQRQFQEALDSVCRSLAEQIVADGEGVQHVVRLQIEQARSEAEARRIGNVIATSMLVKTAWAGADPNWGRILAAIGRSGVTLDPARIDIFLGEQALCRRGNGQPFDEAAAHALMSRSSYDIRVVLRRGRAGVTILTTDLSAEYVRINADYRT
jgi:glutamate N-acetyltransferase/amino-acid N-acetyltransferase